MIALIHHSFCPHSRFVRLALGEYRLAFEPIEERPWERRPEFLALTPEGITPTLFEGDNPPIPGHAGIAEYLDEAHGPEMYERRLMPLDLAGRVEARRLTRWFNVKFYEEVSHWLVAEKIFKRQLTGAQGGGAPNMNAVRAARANMRYHLQYVGRLIAARNWLAGDTLTYADLAAAAHLSCVDYLGEAAWSENEKARDWYARMKSRPSFRPLLAERVAGLEPSPTYADLDF
jgi:glutathione S-transferase